jgi:hypothetical protein
MLYVLVDGDNVQIEAYLSFVKSNLETQFGTEYNLIFYCQSNMIFKYKSARTEKLSIVCSQTNNKNASDARILFQAGKFISESEKNKVVIVSNDKIFEEIIDNQNVFCIGYDTSKSKRLRVTKDNIMKVFTQLIERKEESHDIIIEDFREYFKCHSTSDLKDYIKKNLPELYVSGNDTLYYKTSKV